MESKEFKKTFEEILIEQSISLSKIVFKASSTVYFRYILTIQGVYITYKNVTQFK